MDVERALQDLQTASLNYTEEQRGDGWLADAYFDMAEMNSHQHSKTKDRTRKQELRDRERQNLQRAREEYARVDISNKPPQGFEVLPKRWIVERTLAWLGGFRRLARDFEILTTTAENMIRIAMIKVTVAKCV